MGNGVYDAGNIQAAQSASARYFSVMDRYQKYKTQNQRVCDLWGLQFTYRWFHSRRAQPMDQLAALADYTGQNAALRNEILHRGLAAMVHRLRLRIDTQSGNHILPEAWWTPGDLQWMIDSKSWRGQPIPVIKEKDLKRYGLELFIDRPKVTEPSRVPGRASHNFGTCLAKPSPHSGSAHDATAQPDFERNPGGSRLDSGVARQPTQQTSTQQQCPFSPHVGSNHTQKSNQYRQQSVEAPPPAQGSKDSGDVNPRRAQTPQLGRPKQRKRKLSFTDSGNVKTSKRPIVAAGNPSDSGASMQLYSVTNNVVPHKDDPRTVPNEVANGTSIVKEPPEHLAHADAHRSSKPNSTLESLRLNGLPARESFVSISNFPEAQIVPPLPLLLNQSTSDISTNGLDLNGIETSRAEAPERLSAPLSRYSDITPREPDLQEADTEGDSYAGLSTQAAMSKAQAVFQDAHSPANISSPLTARRKVLGQYLNVPDPATPDAQLLSTQAVLEGLRASPLGASTNKKPTAVSAIATAKNSDKLSSPTALGPSSNTASANPVRGSMAIPAKATNQGSSPAMLISTIDNTGVVPLGSTRSTSKDAASPTTSRLPAKTSLVPPSTAQKYRNHYHPNQSSSAARPTPKGAEAVSRSRFEVFFDKTKSPTYSGFPGGAPAANFPPLPYTIPQGISRSDGLYAGAEASAAAVIDLTTEASALPSKEMKPPLRTPVAPATIGAAINGNFNGDVQAILEWWTPEKRLMSTVSTIRHSQDMPPKKSHQHNSPLLSDERAADNVGTPQRSLTSRPRLLHQAVQEKGRSKGIFVRKELLKTPEPPLATGLATKSAPIEADGHNIPASLANEPTRQVEATEPATATAVQQPANSKVFPPQANGVATVGASEIIATRGHMPSTSITPASSRPGTVPPLATSKDTRTMLLSKPAKRTSFADIQPLSSPSHSQFLNGSPPRLSGGHTRRSLSMETSSLEEQPDSPARAQLSPVKRVDRSSQPNTNDSPHDPMKGARTASNLNITPNASFRYISAADTPAATVQTTFSMPPSGDLSQLSPSQVLQDGQQAQFPPIPTQQSLGNGNLPLSTGLRVMSSAGSGNEAGGVEEGRSGVGMGIGGMSNGLIKPMESSELEDALEAAGTFLSTGWGLLQGSCEDNEGT